jgi:BASS family bile acid:Na+ symporter
MQIDMATNEVKSRAWLTLLARFNAYLRGRYLAVLLSVVGLALLFPATGKALQALTFFSIPLTPWVYDFSTLALTVIMFSASVNCRVRDFRQLFHRRRAGVAAMAMIYLVVPLMTAGLSVLVFRVFTSEAASQLRLGLLFLGAMPVAMTSAVWVRLNQGNTPLLVAVVTLTTVLALVTIPTAAVFLAGAREVHTPVSSIVKQLVISVMFPLSLGLMLRAWASRWVDRYQPVFSLFGLVGLLGSLFGNIAASSHALTSEGPLLVAVTVVTVALNAAFYWSGVIAARMLNLPQEDSIALVFSSGMRNMGVAMVIGAVSFPDLPLVTIPPVLFSISQQVLAGYLSKTLLATNGVLGVPIGADVEDLRSFLSRSVQRGGPGLTMLVMRPAVASAAEQLDAVITQTRRLLRGSDFVSHVPVGFAVVLPHTDESGVGVVLAKLRQAFAGTTPPVELLCASHTIAEERDLIRGLRAATGAGGARGHVVPTEDEAAPALAASAVGSDSGR